MKQFKLSMAFVALFAMLFTSCSKDEAVDPSNDSEKGSISFATLLNDLISTNKDAVKQAMAIPACTDDTPVFVEVVLSGTEDVGTMENPLVVSVNPTPGNYDGDPEAEYFTEESSDLELLPGDYVLEYFAVWNGDPTDPASDLIWIAPHDGGSLAAFVDDALPKNISLGAGVKKYVDVEVLCFDDRIVNEYGYLFFDIEDTQAIEFCIFGNFCPPSGRHYPAAYSVDVWSWEDGVMGDPIHTDLTATVAQDQNGDWAGSPVCMALPDTDGDDEYYFEITLLSSDAYGQVTEEVIRTAVLTDAEVRSFFDGDDRLDYFHFREGCDGEDTPPIFDDPTDEVTMYRACLDDTNGSGAIVFAYLELEGNTLQTNIFGFNVENAIHGQHIHGLDDKNANSTCPPESASGEDDIITFAEGLPFYGDVRIPLQLEGGAYPTAANMKYEYSRTFTLGSDGIISAEDLGALENRSIVVHGMTLDGEYDGSLPIACAEIEKVGECETCGEN